MVKILQDFEPFFGYRNQIFLKLGPFITLEN